MLLRSSASGHRVAHRVLLAVLWLAAHPVPAAAQPAVAVDADYSIAAGAATVLAVQHVLSAAEDRVLPPRRFDESGAGRRALGVAYRLGKFVALDLPQDHLLLVVGHEVFGHGSRLREAGAEGIAYSIEAPPPYGPGGGSTGFDGELRLTRAEWLGILIGGIEHQNVVSDLIARSAARRGALRYREAWLYLESRLAGLEYILSTSDRSGEGHDVRAFLEHVNEDCPAPSCSPLARGTLERRALVMLADPWLAYAAYGTAVSYLWRGEAMTGVPMIPLPGGARYLPSMRFDLAPYGTEWTSEHLVVQARRAFTVSARVGRTGAEAPWGVGVRADDLLVTARMRLSSAGHLWRQPPLDGRAGTLRTGGAVTMTAVLPVRRGGARARAGLLAEIGYKSDGFLRGERIGRGPIVRIGLALGDL